MVEYVWNVDAKGLEIGSQVFYGPIMKPIVL
jgi:hypothetical protein